MNHTSTVQHLIMSHISEMTARFPSTIIKKKVWVIHKVIAFSGLMLHSSPNLSPPLSIFPK